MGHRVKTLWALELDISREARKKDYRVIHSETDSDGHSNLCVYGTKKEALEETKGRDHKAHAVKFVRVERKRS